MLLGFSPLFPLILLNPEWSRDEPKKGKKVLDREVSHELSRGI